MPGQRVTQNLQMPHPRDWQGGQMPPYISPGLGEGELGAAGIGWSIKRNLENFQVHLLDELNFEFSIIGVSETKIISGKEMDFNPSISGYVFEYVPTPLASHICYFIV